MTEYIVKAHFWLACVDTLSIEAESDAEAIETAKREAASTMESQAVPDFIDYDERREGSISYIDRVTEDGHEEASGFVSFDEDRLYPDWHVFIGKVAALSVEIDSDEAKLNALWHYVALIEEAKTLHVQFA